MEYPQRKPNRLKDYDYAPFWAYFVTICAKNRECLFGDVIDGEMVLNDCEQIVTNVWGELTNHNQEILLDAHCIMPNHIHGIIRIVGNGSKPFRNETPKYHYGIPEIIRQFKTFSTKHINIYRKRNGSKPFPTSSIWQKSFYDHIIRDEDDYNRIDEYIQNNPARWTEDCHD